MTDNADRNAAILRLYRADKTYDEIAAKLELTRGVVAGVVFRDRWPAQVRVCSPNSGGKPNMTGRGYHPPYERGDAR